MIYGTRKLSHSRREKNETTTERAADGVVHPDWQCDRVWMAEGKWSYTARGWHSWFHGFHFPINYETWVPIPCTQVKVWCPWMCTCNSSTVRHRVKVAESDWLPQEIQVQLESMSWESGAEWAKRAQDDPLYPLHEYSQLSIQYISGHTLYHPCTYIIIILI